MYETFYFEDGTQYRKKVEKTYEDTGYYYPHSEEWVGMIECFAQGIGPELAAIHGGVTHISILYK